MSSLSTSAFQPVATSERIATLDVLRGFALFGILLMNMEAFSGPMDMSFTGIDPHWQGWDYWADAFVYVFVQGKFFTLFSLLFGAGFAVMAQRAAVAGRDFTRFYLRRSLGLLVIGVLHGLLLWSGDILVAYALLSFVLLAFREAPRSWLPALGTMAYLGAAVLMLMLGALMQLVPADAASAQAAAAAKAIEAQRQAYGHGSYLQAVAQRLLDVFASLGALLVVGPQVLGMFLIGAWFARSGAIAEPGRYPRLWAGLRWLLLPIGLAVMLLSTWVLPYNAPGQFNMRSAGAYALTAVAGLMMCLGYLAWGVRWSRHLQWLAPAGRMALSNYLGQSLVCTLVFYGYGLGWFEQVGRASQLLFAVVLFAMQVLLSQLWLRRFQYGPVEWLWRAFTYLQLPPLRR
ncbi:DUF418 domain-containing protein [uncultured Stenotrophomonas sp.]|uniref:DUF418 domain-containing protein n=1 Tax=uncultured Stenotrophomonas sp. TaxID=165438 RepID=UPI0025F437DC|nr:DUF418 domain-containing protein [uncultured Stenotrophomonas sp.]